MESTPVIEKPDETITSGFRLPLPPWDMYTVAVALFSGYILLPLLASNVLTLAMPFMEDSYRIFVQQGVTLLSWIAIFGFLGWRHRVSIWPYLGVRVNRPWGYYLRETFYVVCVMLTLMLLLNFWIKSTGGVPDKPYQQYDSATLKTIAFFAVMVAPMLEEVIFRGFVQSTFHKISPPVRTVVFTCLLFVLFHGLYFDKLHALVYVLILGLALGYWRERTQSTLPGIIGHLFNNTLASFTLFS